MTQQEFSVGFDLYNQIASSKNLDIVGPISNWWLVIDEAKNDRQKMRKFRKMLSIHDRAYKKETVNQNSF